MENLYASYLGPDRADIKNGKNYEVMQLKDTNIFYGVKDDSGEWYAYPKESFRLIDSGGNSNA